MMNSVRQKGYPSVAPEFILVLCGVRVAQSLVFCVILCRILFVFFSFFTKPLYCLSLDLPILFTPLVSSTFPSLRRRSDRMFLSNTITHFPKAAFNLTKHILMQVTIQNIFLIKSLSVFLSNRNSSIITDIFTKMEQAQNIFSEK